MKEAKEPLVPAFQKTLTDTSSDRGIPTRKKFFERLTSEYAVAAVAKVFPDGSGGKRLRRAALRKNMMRKDGIPLYLVKWVVPMLFCGLGFYIQSVFLHYATYSYVHEMTALTPSQRLNPEYASLADPVEAAMGPREDIKLPMLDAVAAFFPFLFMTITILRPAQTLQVWTKVLICAGFLFSLKGLIGAMTTVPDSSGWQVCKDRVHPEGLAWMSANHTLSEFFTLDWHWVTTYHQPLRYCSDMMYSGHTFCVTLFALGCYEQLRIVMEGSLSHNTVSKLMCCCGGVATDTDDFKVRRFAQVYTVLKMLALVFVSVLSIGEQCIEIYFVLKSRFHYTSDIVVALVLTFLFYTNTAIAVFAKQWELRGVYFLVGGSPERGEMKDETKWLQKDMWVSRGDVFVPWCCLPFCCMSGRGHLYSDDGILEIYDSVMKGACQFPLSDEAIGHHIREFVQEMNLLEGIPQAEVLSLLGIDPQMHSNHARVQSMKVAVMSDNFSPPEVLQKREKDLESPENKLEGYIKHIKKILDKTEKLGAANPGLQPKIQDEIEKLRAANPGLRPETGETGECLIV